MGHPELLALVGCAAFHPQLVTTRTAPWDEAGEAVCEERVKLIAER